jgi:isochorismate pyruvate lyase
MSYGQNQLICKFAIEINFLREIIFKEVRTRLKVAPELISGKLYPCWQNNKKDCIFGGFMDNVMKKPSECNTMEEIRDCIDALDKEIIRMISERFGYAKAIVRFKTDEKGIQAQPRYDSVIQERRRLATENGLDPDVIEKMYRTMMNYFIEEELKIFRNKK